jgi:RNA polymerase subunit RPABC4/transcription elongation factor Spt4
MGYLESNKQIIEYMYCKECGSLLADDAKFCSNCGNKIDDGEASELTKSKNTSYTEGVCHQCNSKLITARNLFGAKVFICPNCNTNIKSGICPVCHSKLLTQGALRCYSCGFSMSNNNNFVEPTPTSSIKSEIEAHQPIEAIQYSNPFKAVSTEPELKCPKCGSTHITSNKKGYSAGKAIAGVVLAGGIGLLGGFLGSGKVKITCLKCGHSWNV